MLLNDIAVEVGKYALLLALTQAEDTEETTLELSSIASCAYDRLGMRR